MVGWTFKEVFTSRSRIVVGWGFHWPAPVDRPHRALFERVRDKSSHQKGHLPQPEKTPRPSHLAKTPKSKKQTENKTHTVATGHSGQPEIAPDRSPPKIRCGPGRTFARKVRRLGPSLVGFDRYSLQRPPFGAPRLTCQVLGIREPHPEARWYPKRMKQKDGLRRVF